MANEKRKKWLHILLWGICDLALIIPVLLLLWWCGRFIEEKRQKPEPQESAAVCREVEILPSAAALEGEIDL